MPKASNLTTNIVVNIEDDILKTLLDKISELQSQISSVQASVQMLQMEHHLLQLDFNSHSRQGTIQ